MDNHPPHPMYPYSYPPSYSSAENPSQVPEASGYIFPHASAPFIHQQAPSPYLTHSGSFNPASQPSPPWYPFPPPAPAQALHPSQYTTLPPHLYPGPSYPPHDFQPVLQPQSSFHSGSFSQHHSHDTRPGAFSWSSSLPHYSSSDAPDIITDNKPAQSSIYPPIDGLLASVSISSHDAPPPSSSLISSSAQYVMPSSMLNQASYSYPHPTSGDLSTQIVDSTHCLSSSSYHEQSLQLVPLPQPSKASLKVLLLHGSLDIWIFEAKNLPNMDMFSKKMKDMLQTISGNGRGKVQDYIHKPNSLTSDPYVSISVCNAVVGRTYVLSNNENPAWRQHFNLPVAHYAAEVRFIVKDSDIVGSQLIGFVDIPVERIYSGAKVEGSYPILNTKGKPCNPSAELRLSIKYITIEQQTLYHCGVWLSPDYCGIPGTYFPLRKSGKVRLYQDAHVPDGCLPGLKLGNGADYNHGKCWQDIFDAISQARKLIYIAGWSVYHNVRLVRDAGSGTDCTLGELLKYKSQEGVRVLLLVWDDPTSRKFWLLKTDGIMQTHDEETRRFFKHSSVHVLLCPRSAGKRHSWAKQQEVGAIYTHHQKIVVVDADAGNDKRKIAAFIGGLDLCDGRYDTPRHPLFGTLETIHKDDFHNPTFPGSNLNCPREPWHDLHCRIDGPAAYDVLANFEDRWFKAAKKHGVHKLKHSANEDALLRIDRIPDIIGMFDASYVTTNDPESWDVQIFRSIDSNSVKGFPKDPKDATSKNLVCGKNVLIDMSIHTAYVNAIRAAQHYIYIENQYFLGSSYNWPSHNDLGANNLIPMEIALKVADKIRANERFAVYIVIPMWPEGVPTSVPTQRILFWQSKTMQMMYEIIYKALQETGLEKAYQLQDYLNFFCLGNREAPSGTEPTCQTAPNTPLGLAQKYRRFMIYVHSKGMIVDDEYVILGSANINQRSLEGTRDTEIAMGAYQPLHTWSSRRSHPLGQIFGYRMSLWAEHIGGLEECFISPESLECVRKVKEVGEKNWQQFAAEEVTEMHGHLLKYPVDVDARGKVRPLAGCETFPDVGGSITGTFLAIQENLTI